MKKTKTVMIFFVALLVLTSCSSTETVKVGWIGPLTGPSAVLGTDGVTAAEIAVAEINSAGGINGRQIELLIEDDQYNTQKAVTVYNKLVNVDGVDIVIMSTYSGVFAVSEQAVEDEVVVIDPLDCNDQLAGSSKTVFCIATDSESIAQVLADDANSKNFSTIGLIYWNSDAFMPLVKDYFVNEFKGKVQTEAYLAGTQDFRTTLTKMSDFDALVLLGYDETGIAMKQARELGFRGQFYTTGTVTSPSLQEASQGAAEGTLFAFWSAPENEKTNRFTELFVAQKGKKPILDLATYPTYDAVKIIAEAIKKEKPLRDALFEIKDYQSMSVVEPVTFDENGAIKISETLFVLEDGKPNAIN